MKITKQTHIYSLSFLVFMMPSVAETVKKPWWKKTTELKEEKPVSDGKQSKKPWWKYPYTKKSDIVTIPKLTPKPIEIAEPNTEKGAPVDISKQFSKVEAEQIAKKESKTTPVTQKNITTYKLKEAPKTAKNLDRLDHTSQVTPLVSKEKPQKLALQDNKTPKPKKRGFFAMLGQLFKKKTNKETHTKSPRRDSRFKDGSESYKVPMLTQKVRRKGKNRFQFNT